jgi:hypothetical protein
MSVVHLKLVEDVTWNLIKVSVRLATGLLQDPDLPSLNQVTAGVHQALPDRHLTQTARVRRLIDLISNVQRQRALDDRGGIAQNLQLLSDHA